MEKKKRSFSFSFIMISSLLTSKQNWSKHTLMRIRKTILSLWRDAAVEGSQKSARVHIMFTNKTVNKSNKKQNLKKMQSDSNKIQIKQRIGGQKEFNLKKTWINVDKSQRVSSSTAHKEGNVQNMEYGLRKRLDAWELIV